MTRRRGRHPAVRVLVAVLVGTALTVGLTACSGPPDLSGRAAERLEDAVAAVVAAAEDGRFETAAAGLAAVRTELERAADAGEVSVERYRRIDGALTAAEAEVATLVAAAAAAAAAADAPVATTSAPTAPVDAGPASGPKGPGARPGEAVGPGAGDGPGNGRGNGAGPGGDRGRGNGP